MPSSWFILLLAIQAVWASGSFLRSARIEHQAQLKSQLSIRPSNGAVDVRVKSLVVGNTKEIKSTLADCKMWKHDGKLIVAKPDPEKKDDYLAIWEAKSAQLTSASGQGSGKIADMKLWVTLEDQKAGTIRLKATKIPKAALLWKLVMTNIFGPELETGARDTDSKNQKEWSGEATVYLGNGFNGNSLEKHPSARFSFELTGRSLILGTKTFAIQDLKTINPISKEFSTAKKEAEEKKAQAEAKAEKEKAQEVKAETKEEEVKAETKEEEEDEFFSSGNLLGQGNKGANNFAKIADGFVAALNKYRKALTSQPAKLIVKWGGLPVMLDLDNDVQLLVVLKPSSIVLPLTPSTNQELFNFLNKYRLRRLSTKRTLSTAMLSMVMRDVTLGDAVSEEGVIPSPWTGPLFKLEKLPPKNKKDEKEMQGAAMSAAKAGAKAAIQVAGLVGKAMLLS